ncbi:MAG: DNA mismatch repair protein MutS [Bacteroidales bacterium]|nr:DNA mismatch repair protein MutS [Bacteroidales bacterium]
MKKEEGLAPTPLMRQYQELKAKYPGTILLFRVGDFYETFGEDAVITSSILNITLTKRSNGAAADVELAGFPYHALDVYLPKLVRAGQRVAICEQLEDPKFAKKLVKRGVTEVVTPGVTFHENVLDNTRNNYLASIFVQHQTAGVAFIDVSTGEFFAAEGSIEQVARWLHNFQPSEVLIPRSWREKFFMVFGSFNVFILEDWIFTEQFAEDTLLKQFKVVSLSSFGLDKLMKAKIAAGTCLYYIQQTRTEELSHVRSISLLHDQDYVWIDNFTLKNLEILNPLHEQGRALYDVMNKTVTPAGSRLLRKWLTTPLFSKQKIDERLLTVDFFVRYSEKIVFLQQKLKEIIDIERFVGRLAVLKVSPRELIQLKHSIKVAEEIYNFLHKEDPCKNFLPSQFNLNNVHDLINSFIVDDPSVQIQKGGIIRQGINQELDELRLLFHDSKNFLEKLLAEEIHKTGISSLKLGFNNVFGYYFEVTHTHRHKVPQHWIRKQTLTHAERYVTPELQEYEARILGAEEKILQIEQELYFQFLKKLQEYIPSLQDVAIFLAQLDVFLSLAKVAIEHRYVRPSIQEDMIIHIEGGRHPVIETVLPAGEKYVENDVYLDNDKQQIIILTGPNMSGKSAYLRQTALIVLLAQCGSFVPARFARIGLVDKIFSRIGASDNISVGQSTFLVEMLETSRILHNFTSRSLIILDEIGRGTATYDGISIAWAITEYFHNHPIYRPKVLFATHYHELNELANRFPRIKNYHVQVKEMHDHIVFLHKVIPGGSEHSFGIHVARMAGIPEKIVKRAEELLHQFEKIRAEADITPGQITMPVQLSIFQLDDPLLEELRQEIEGLDINQITPIEALQKLYFFQQKLSRKQVNQKK